MEGLAEVEVAVVAGAEPGARVFEDGVEPLEEIVLGVEDLLRLGPLAGGERREGAAEETQGLVLTGPELSVPRGLRLSAELTAGRGPIGLA